MYPKNLPCPVFFEKEGKVLNNACNHARDTLNRESKLDDIGSQVCRFFVIYVRNISPLSTATQVGSSSRNGSTVCTRPPAINFPPRCWRLLPNAPV